MEKRKIKIVLMSYPMDNRKAKGSALYARKLIENLLADDRFDFYLAHYEKVDDPLYSMAEEIILPHLKLPYASHFISQLLFFWKFRKHKFEIIHWLQPRVYPFFWLAPAKRIVITTFGAGEITAPGPWIFSREVFNFVLTKFINKASALIAASKYGRLEIKKYYGAKEKNIYFSYMGGGENFKVLDKSQSKKLIADKYQIKDSFILNVARHLPHKNITSLIRAYKVLRDKYGRREKLVVVGTKDFDTEKILSEANRSGYQNDIIFISYVEPEDLNSIYRAADLFVFLSLQEGFGMPIIEAMASGTPVVASNTTSMPEVIGEAALPVDPLNINDIAQAMNKGLNDEALKNDLIKKGLIQSAKFTWAKSAEQTKEVYLNLFRS